MNFMNLHRRVLLTLLVLGSIASGLANSDSMFSSEPAGSVGSKALEPMSAWTLSEVEIQMTSSVTSNTAISQVISRRACIHRLLRVLSFFSM